MFPKSTTRTNQTCSGFWNSECRCRRHEAVKHPSVIPVTPPTFCLIATCPPKQAGPDTGHWLQDVCFILIPQLLRPGFWVMWEWRQLPAAMQLMVLAQIPNLALVLVLEWIWVLVRLVLGGRIWKQMLMAGGKGEGPTGLNECREMGSGGTVEAVFV